MNPLVSEIESPELIVARWRSQADEENPAGPLFTAGRFAEADLVEAQSADTARPTACTFSLHHECC